MDALSPNEAVLLREAISGLRTDFRDFAEEVRVTTRMICDPVSGYIPRSEYSERHDMLRAEFEGRLKEQSIGVRWAVGTCIAIGVLMISAFGTIIGLGLHVVR